MLHPSAPRPLAGEGGGSAFALDFDNNEKGKPV